MIFCSGQIPIDPATGEFVSNEVAEQTEQVLKNLTAVLQAAGADLNNVVKTTVFLADMNDFVAMNEVYAKFFSENKPARATVQAARLPRDARVEIECIAVV
jgi:2-iminobutanoate/2-iminopropanoate deaminase